MSAERPLPDECPHCGAGQCARHYWGDGTLYRVGYLCGASLARESPTTIEFVSCSGNNLTAAEVKALGELVDELDEPGEGEAMMDELKDAIEVELEREREGEAPPTKLALLLTVMERRALLCLLEAFAHDPHPTAFLALLGMAVARRDWGGRFPTLETVEVALDGLREKLA